MSLFQCASSIGIDSLYPMIDECAQGIEGQQLLHDVGVKQNLLSPALYWVPWVIINGVSKNVLKSLKVK